MCLQWIYIDLDGFMHLNDKYTILVESTTETYTYHFYVIREDFVPSKLALQAKLVG
jgi:hypothetical protein